MMTAAQRAAKAWDDRRMRPSAMPSAVASGMATAATVSVLTRPAAMDIQYGSSGETESRLSEMRKPAD
ncbi:hypothetical protein D3C71_1844270 [compost metagenome]